MLRGGCFCGLVRYEIAAVPFHETNCHCSMCRRLSGAAFVTWFSVPRSAFQLVGAEPKRFASSRVGKRAFCGDCGTQLTFEHASYPDEIDVTTCSLDHPEEVPPKDHTQTSTQLPWIALGDGLPKHNGAR